MRSKETLSNASLFVISPAWPALDNGYGLAIKSSLEQYCRVFGDVHFVCLAEAQPPQTALDFSENIILTHIRCRLLPKFVRFILSLGDPKTPATSFQFRRKMIRAQVLNTIGQRKDERDNSTFIIFEDVPIAIGLSSFIRYQFPAVKVAIRSHNVLARIFDPLAEKGNILSKMIWRFEVSRMRRAEIANCKSADRVWAISEEDRKEYSRLGVACDGVLGVSINSDYFAEIPAGDKRTVVFVGGVDLRKRLGLVSFVEGAWPTIRAEIPDAQFVIAGSGSEKLDDPANGIHGLGYVRDDREIWGKGQIAINPQEIGSGIKLKSIIAMLAGKALVSTPVGIEGIPAIPNIHFLVAPNAKSLAQPIIQLMKEPPRAERIGEAARSWAQNEYSPERLEKSAIPLLKDFIEGDNKKNLMMSS